MGNLGGGEILVILLVALIVLGPDKLPGAARQFGNVFRQFREMSLDFRAEFEDALNAAEEPIAQSPEELAAENAARARGAELLAAENAAKANDADAAPTPDPKPGSTSANADHGGTGSIGSTAPFAAVTPPAEKPSLAYRPDTEQIPETVCLSCGHQSPKGARFCINCGSGLGPAATPVTEAPADEPVSSGPGPFDSASAEPASPADPGSDDGDTEQ